MGRRYRRQPRHARGNKSDDFFLPGNPADVKDGGGVVDRRQPLLVADGLDRQPEGRLLGRIEQKYIHIFAYRSVFEEQAWPVGIGVDRAAVGDQELAIWG